MTDSGKHSALRQSSDGSFEIVLDHTGLSETSESEASYAEVVPPSAQPSEPTSKRVLAFGVIGVAAVALVAIVGLFAFGGGDQPQDEQVATGFKPYEGDGPDDVPKPDPNQKRAVKAALAELDEEEAAANPPPEVEVEEITESEPGWELTESDEVIVEEDVIEVVEVEPVPVEEEEPEDRVVESEGGTIPSLAGRRDLSTIRPNEITPRPRIPNFNANSLTKQRLQQLPIRSIRTNDEEVAELEEVEGDEEVVEEEYVEEEEVEEE